MMEDKDLHSSVMRQEEEEELIIMEDELYTAAMHNKVSILSTKNPSHNNKSRFFTKTCASNNNLIHIAVRYRSWDFAIEAAKLFPGLVWETNIDGNTPLHLIAQFPTVNGRARDLRVYIVREATRDTGGDLTLRVQNLMGNTPLHLAFIHGNLPVAETLVQKDPGLAQIVNASMEAPLHLAIKHFPRVDPGGSYGGLSTFKQWIMAAAERGNEGNGMFNRSTRQIYLGGLIGKLLKQAPYVARWSDTSGLSPLHRAALLPKNYNLTVIKHIIEYCPQSMEVCDSIGKTVLHHLVNGIGDVTEAKEWLCSTNISSLINCQDKQGNTVAHLALINDDFNMLHVLEYCPTDWDLIINQGLSPTSLLQQRHLEFAKMAKSGTMPKEVNNAAENKDGCALLLSCKEFFRGDRWWGLQSQDSTGRNCIHKLFQFKHGDVIIPDDIIEVLKFCPITSNYDLADNNGDTPTHILAQLNLDTLMIHLATGPRDDSLPIDMENPLYRDPQPDYLGCFGSHYQQYTYEWVNLGDTDFFTGLIQSWLNISNGKVLKQNVKGNTPLHEALLAKNYQVFTQLAEYLYCDTDHYDSMSANYDECRSRNFFPNAGSQPEQLWVNNDNETLLHLLAPLNPIPKVKDGVMENIIKQSTTNGDEIERHLYNKEGSSLLVVAIRAGNLKFATQLCSCYPRIAELRDSNGQTFWHELINQPPMDSSFDFANSSFTDEAICRQLATKDHQGQTPLHWAIERRRFDLAETFLGLGGKHTPNGSHIFQDHLLKIPNTEGITSADKLGELPYVPPEFEEFMGRVSTMIGIRSIWGIPSTQMKDYVNTLGVIAALLTTITFTAAFTVPGGLDQEKGTPLLMRELSFQFFIISDIVAMCLSMMVLFCLLWIMATGNKSKALVLLDFSIILLQLSFYTTLITFMTGLYATTHAVNLWVAVVALVLCSMLIMLMQKCLVMKLIIPSGKCVLILFDKAFRYGRKLRKKFNVKYPPQSRSPRPVLPLSSS